MKRGKELLSSIHFSASRPQMLLWPAASICHCTSPAMMDCSPKLSQNKPSSLSRICQVTCSGSKWLIQPWCFFVGQTGFSEYFSIFCSRFHKSSKHQTPVTFTFSTKATVKGTVGFRWTLTFLYPSLQNRCFYSLLFSPTFLPLSVVEDGPLTCSLTCSLEDHTCLSPSDSWVLSLTFLHKDTVLQSILFIILLH